MNADYKELRIYLYPLAIYSIVSVCAVLMLSACTQAQYDRLKYVGKEPPMQKLESPTEQPDYAPISWPAENSKPAPILTANSLWQGGSKTFFKDQRAREVGDILRVQVNISDKAELDNKTERTRTNTEGLDVLSAFGIEEKIFDGLPGQANPADLIDIAGDLEQEGEGIIEREEVIETEVAAVVTQVLPNKNMVIRGTQEIRVNHEIRQLTIQGIVRPEDIASNNIINSSQIAEARISYGGRGLITDLQQPRIGSQLMDILSPF